MRRWIPMLLPVLVAGCDPISFDRDLAWPDSGRDAVLTADLAVPDGDAPAPADPGPDALGPDVGTPDVPGADVPSACLAVLQDWQCAGQAGGCAPWQECHGVHGCDEPPCWGVCQDFPGACLPRTGDLPCQADLACGADKCADRVPGGYGVCKGLPSEDACWTDENCPPGRYCAGALACGPTSLCASPPVPGRCLARPAAEQCWSDADCPVPGVCPTCTPGRPGCAEGPWTCAAGPRTACASQQDCPGDAPFCIGTPGYCIEGPGRTGGDCWLDAHCGPGLLCHGTAPCPAGAGCLGSPPHAGLCDDPPAEGAGVRVVLPGGAPVLEGGPVVVLNEGTVPIYYVSCWTMGLQLKQGDDWPGGQFAAYYDDPACDADDPRLLHLAPGSARVFLSSPVHPGLAKARARLVFLYHLGCVPGAGLDKCRVQQEWRATSPEFQLPSAPAASGFATPEASHP